MADPYWERFCTPLATRILALITGRDATGPGGTRAGDYILEEPIAAVLGDGTYEVGGDTLQAKGRAELQVGQTVHVLWQDDRRSLILTHRWQRAQPGVRPQPEPGGPILEELWFVGADVWFRNADIAASLNLQRFGMVGTIIDLAWGARADRFIIHTRQVVTVPSPTVDNHFYYVFKFDREPGDVLATGTEPADAVALESTWALHTDTHLVAHCEPISTLGPPYDTPPPPVDLRLSHIGRPAASPTASIGLAGVCLSSDGEPVVTVMVNINCGGRSGVVPGSDPPITTATGFQPFQLAYPVLINLATHAHLLDTYADGAAAFGPDAGDLRWTGFPINGFPVVNEADLPGENTWAVYPQDNDQVQQFQVLYPLVVDGQLVSWVGVSERMRSRTSWDSAAGYPQTYIPRHRTLCWQPPPTAAGEAAALLTLVPGTELFQLQLRTTWASNETHYLWHKFDAGLSTFRTYLTSAALGTTADVGTFAVYNDRNVRLLAPSFAWQPGRSPVVQPTAEQDRFLLLWDFDTGAALVDPGAPLPLVEDTALESIKALAPLPPGAPTQPTGAGGLAIHVINREDILAPLGRYRPHATPSPESEAVRQRS